MKLEDLAEISSGQGAPQEESTFSDSGYPFIRAGNLESLLVSNNEYASCKLINTSTAQKYKLYLFPRNTIVFAKSGMSATKGRIYSLMNDSYIVNHLATVLPNPKLLHHSYLKYFLVAFSPSRLIKDSAYPSISLSDIKQIQIPLPPLEEQHRIVKILDLAQLLIEKRKQAISYLDDYIKAVFLDMFGDPVSNPKGWERRTLAELLIKIESGHSPVCLDRPANIGEWGVLKLGAVTKCYFIPTENKALPEALAPNVALEVKVGDVLFSRKNTYDLVAACAYVFETPPKLMMSDLIFRLVPKNKKILNPIYLQALFSSSSKRKKIQQLAGGAAGSMPNISKSKLLFQQVELPPPNLQEKFALVVTKVWQLKNQMLSQLKELEDNFQAELQRAFRGE